MVESRLPVLHPSKLSSGNKVWGAIAVRTKRTRLMFNRMLEKDDVELARIYNREAALLMAQEKKKGIVSYYSKFSQDMHSIIHEKLRKAVEHYELALGIDGFAFQKPKLRINSRFDKETTLQLLLELAECKSMFPFHTPYAINDAARAYILAIELADEPGERARICKKVVEDYSRNADEIWPIARGTKRIGGINYSGSAYSIAGMFEQDPAAKSDYHLKSLECAIDGKDAIILMPHFRNAIETLYNKSLEPAIRQRSMYVLLKDAEGWARGDEMAQAAAIVQYALEIYGDGTAFEDGAGEKLVTLWQEINRRIGDDPDGRLFAWATTSQLGAPRIVDEVKRKSPVDSPKQLE